MVSKRDNVPCWIGMEIMELTGKQALQHLAGLKQKFDSLYQQACEFDGVQVDEKFVVFSENNQFAQQCDNAWTQYVNAIQEYRTHKHVAIQ